MLSFPILKKKYKSRRSVTVEALCLLWLEERRPGVKISTYVKYSSLVRLHILPAFENRMVHTLTRQDLEAYAENLLVAGRKDGTGGLSAKTVRDVLGLFHNILSYGCQKNLVDSVPSVDGILAPVRRQRPNIMSPQDCRRLETYLRSRTDLGSCGILLALYTGMRLGEVCALRWRNIDLNQGVLRVDATIQRLPLWNGEKKQKTSLLCMPPKSESSVRLIPIPELLMGSMRALEPGDKEAFFLTGSPERCMEPRLLEYRFQQALSDCGLEHIHFHALRHTFATRCVEVGFDTKSLSEILGHSNVQTTMALYVHPTIEHKRKNMNKVCY